MLLFVRYNQGPGVAVELRGDASVAELKRLVGGQQGVHPEPLRVLFAGKELPSSATLQECDLPEQSTVHVVHPRQVCTSQQPPASSPGLFRNPVVSTVPDESDGDLDGRRHCSTLFVFCKTCRSIQPGKLRVRCHSCKQTMLTVTKEPNCWEDVLLPARISGVCQSEGCHGNQAEFFMKCASHPTADNDVSVPLDLIVKNTKEIPCIACTDVMDPVLVFQCSDKHVICLNCFHTYCETRLEERQFVYHPVIGYSLPCAVRCEDSLIKELHHFRILGDEQYGRYLQLAAERYLLSSGGLMCPSPGCGAGLLPTDGSRMVQCDRRTGCGFIFCRTCRLQYHEGPCLSASALTRDDAAQSFSVETAAAVRGRWEQESLLAIQKMTKQCPSCSLPIERDGGCMHMRCPQCGENWCWFCGLTWTNTCMSRHWFG
ncbi:E3 ubiquitin-protein ligase parkin [Neosynchiropus ocellatus]